MASNPTPSAPPVVEMEHLHSAFEMAVIRYRKQLILVGAVAVVGVLGWLGSKVYKEHKHNAAAYAFSRAQTVADLEAAATAHPGQIAAGSALLQAAQLQTADGKSTEAIATLKKFLDSFPGHPLHDLGQLRLGELQTLDNNIAEARTNYEAVVTSGSAYGSAALLRLGDLAWAEGKTDEARKHYEKLMTTYPGDILFGQAEARTKQITRKAPVLIDFVAEPPAPAPGSDLPPSLDALKDLTAPSLLSDPAAPAPEVEAPAPEPAGTPAPETPAAPEAPQ